MGALLQFGVMMYKNLKLKWTSKKATCCEICFPVAFGSLLIAFYYMFLETHQEAFISNLPSLSGFVGSNSKLMYSSSNNTDANLVISKLQSIYGISLADIVEFSTESELEDYYQDEFLKSWAAIVFSDNFTLPSTGIDGNVNYTLRFPKETVPSPGDTSANGNFESVLYADSGFMTLQYAMDTTITTLMLESVNSSNSDYEYTLQYGETPLPPESNEDVAKTVRNSLIKLIAAVWVTLALMATPFTLVGNIVLEKESRLREGMFMMGLPSWVYWGSWFIFGMVMTLPATSLVCGLLCWTALYNHATYGVVWFLFMLFSASLISMMFVVSTFINKSRFAGMVAFVIVMGMAAVAPAIEGASKINSGAKSVFSIFSPVALQLGNVVIVHFANDGGMTWEQTDKNVRGLPSINGIYCLLAFDTVLYLFFAWYLNQVIPGEFGVSRPWYFLFTPSYWKSEWFNQKLPTLTDDIRVDLEDLNPEDQEPVAGLNPAVKIRHLRREFQTATGPYVAVANLNLDLYEGQVLSLLGHNGAGKSTTISMMTGLIPVTSGGAEVFGLNLNSELSRIRRLLGVCPQHDILWNELSVFDHLIIFSGLKGVPILKMRQAIKKLIQDLELSEKTFAAAGSLSGGQKRRLCVGMMINDVTYGSGIAFAAGSKLIFLDEPTSGLDPHSRRAIWELVKSNKEGRVIVLTSHFMDECEVLGDRIAILSHGKLRCVGTSLFLKAKFGVGYILSMAKKSGCKSEEVIEFVEQNLAGEDEDAHTELLSDAAAELTLRLRRSDLPKFSKFFHTLEGAKDDLLIDSYGISLTTLEEVFLKIAHQDERSRDNHEQENQTNNNKTPSAARKISEPSPETPLINGITVKGEGSWIWTQVWVLLWKRFLITRREILFFLFQVGLPVACVIGAMIMSYFLGKLASDPTSGDQDLLQMSINMYSDISDFNSTLPYGLKSQNFSIDPLSNYINYTLLYAGDEDGVNKYMKDSGADLLGSYYFSNLDYANNEYKAAALYTYLYSHSLPILTNILDQAILQLVTNTTQTIVTNSKPLAGYLELLYSDINRQALSSLVLAVGFSAAPAGFAVHIVKEREMRVKQLQQISGTSRIAYWLSFFLFDTLTSLIIVFATMITLYVGDSVYRDYMGSIFLLLFCYMIGTIPLTYVLSYGFQKHHTSYGAIAGLYLFFAFCFIVAHISVLANSNPGSIAVVVTDYVFCALSPVYCLNRGLFIIVDFFNSRTYWDSEDGFITKQHFLGMSLQILAGYFGFFLILLLIIDSSFEIGSFFTKIGHLINKISRIFKGNKLETEDLSALEDEDVAKEREVVKDIDSSNLADNLVLIKHLRKAWDKENVAVKDLCLHIKRDECFGLLGANGAGKTTTMSMLCGDVLPTRGTAFLNGYNIGYQLSAARSSLGFCPQFDALFGSMTGREHLYMYAKIRGIPSQLIKTTVNAFLSMLKLEEYADKYTEGYSGGNKRKLSFAIALLGNPTVVFLDEPSTGMDPFSKRFMWNVIASVTRGRCVILTTHSMEECDSLCSRIGIMNKGVMRCLGSSQHLKSKYGSGYTVEMKASSTDDLPKIALFMEVAFPGSKVTESHGNMQKFAVPQQELSLGKMFETIEAAKPVLKLDDYSISQTTLEQIFLHISNS